MPATPTAEGNAWPANARCNGASGSVCAEDAVFVGASRRPQRAGDNCRRDCFPAVHQMHLEADLAATPARSISLPRPATVNGAPLSETKVKADWPRAFSPRSARKFVAEHSETYTVSRSAAN